MPTIQRHHPTHTYHVTHVGDTYVGLARAVSYRRAVRCAQKRAYVTGTTIDFRETGPGAQNRWMFLSDGTHIQIRRVARGETRVIDGI